MKDIIVGKAAYVGRIPSIDQSGFGCSNLEWQSLKPVV